MTKAMKIAIITVLLLAGCEPTGRYASLYSAEDRIQRLEQNAREASIGEIFPDIAAQPRY